MKSENSNTWFIAPEMFSAKFTNSYFHHLPVYFTLILVLVCHVLTHKRCISKIIIQMKYFGFNSSTDPYDLVLYYK